MSTCISENPYQFNIILKDFNIFDAKAMRNALL